ncbi:hypothetical protein GS506_06765 [Rhodococcus hoagii]|nr:hypothetical protein [Prescottella equi]
MNLDAIDLGSFSGAVTGSMSGLLDIFLSLSREASSAVAPSVTSGAPSRSADAFAPPTPVAIGGWGRRCVRGHGRVP